MTAITTRTVPLLAFLAVILHALLLRQTEGFQPVAIHRHALVIGATTTKPVSMSMSMKKASDSEEKQGSILLPMITNRASAMMMSAWATSSLLFPAAAAVAAATTEGEGEYVYGAVDAPVGLAVGAGILAIATAALPVLLRGGEEAFEEIRERDAGTFGSTDKNKDVLKSRRK